VKRGEFVMRMILYIEGYKNQRLLVSNELREEGYAVISVSDGKTGLRLLSNLTPDIIVTESMLPDMDVYEFVDHAHDICGNIPIILYSTLLYAPECIQKYGISAFVSKSCDTSAIVRAIKKVTSYCSDKNIDVMQTSRMPVLS
jgi:CheY-like chemotaxis protein